jgi:predicted Holliday junction resolvase-like endonuclease
MSNEQRVSNEQIDKKLESFVEVMLQKMIDLHQEIKALKRKVHEQDKKLQASLQSNVVDERIGL